MFFKKFEGFQKSDESQEQLIVRLRGELDELRALYGEARTAGADALSQLESAVSDKEQQLRSALSRPRGGRADPASAATPTESTHIDKLSQRLKAAQEILEQAERNESPSLEAYREAVQLLQRQLEQARTSDHH